MPGIGSTGCYEDGEGNEYAATVVGRSFEMKPNPDTGQLEKVESGNFEVEGTFRDGTKRIFSNVKPGDLFEADRSDPPADPIED